MLALLGILAVALTATTLPTARRRQRQGSGGSAVSGDGSGVGIPSRSNEPLPQLLDLPFLPELLAVLAVLLVATVLWSLYHHWRALFRVAVVVIAFSVLLTLLLELGAFDLPTQPVSNATGPSPNVSGGGGSGGETASTGPSPLSLVLVALVGVVLLVAAVTVNRRSGTDERSDSEGGDRATGEAAAVGRAAGRAADRIAATAELDNEVYRAWREMTGLLAVEQRETTTPREFERAAVEAGMEPKDVADLTDLFERVRYDDDEATPADERRAIELLERIESRYTADGASGASETEGRQ